MCINFVDVKTFIFIFVVLLFFFRKVEYLNARGSFLDPHTVKAVLKNGTEVNS